MQVSVHSVLVVQWAMVGDIALTFIGLRAGLHRRGHLLQQLIQVRSPEQAIAIHRVAMHREFAAGCPIANRVLVDAEVLSRLRGVHVF